MQMQNVEKQVNQGHEPGPTLPCVPPITSKLVLATVGFTRLGDPDTDHGMKNQRRKNQRPLDQREQFSRAVDEEYCSLECLSPVEQARVGREMHCHVQAERNDTQQRMDPPNEKLMADKKAGFGGRFRAHLWMLKGYESVSIQP